MRPEDEPKLLKLFSMRTCLDRRYTVEEQAKELGVDRVTIHRWVKSSEYQQIVKAHTADSFPMRNVALEEITDDLLPTSLRTAKDILENPRAPATAKVALINSIWKLVYETISPPKEALSEETRDLLRRANVTQNINIILANAPPEFRDALRQVLPETIEAEAVPVDHSPD